MSKLIWDEFGKRKYYTGVSQGVLYVEDSPGVAWNGIKSITESSDGADPVVLYADNIQYASFRAAENFSASIEAYAYPEEFSECLGVASSIGGLYLDGQNRKSFSLCYRTETLEGFGWEAKSGYQLHLLYNLSASPTEKNYETYGTSTDAITFNWDIDSVPIVIEGYKPTSIVILDSMKIEKSIMKKIEDELFGTEDKNPRMPSPQEIMELASKVDLHSIFIEVLSVPKHWIWDTFNFNTSDVPTAIREEAERHIFYEPDDDVEYIQPSIAYRLDSEDEASIRTYFVDVIDEKDPSKFLEALKKRIKMIRISKEKKDNFTYYHYLVNAY